MTPYCKVDAHERLWVLCCTVGCQVYANCRANIHPLFLGHSLANAHGHLLGTLQYMQVLSFLWLLLLVLLLLTLHAVLVLVLFSNLVFYRYGVRVCMQLCRTDQETMVEGWNVWFYDNLEELVCSGSLCHSAVSLP